MSKHQSGVGRVTIPSEEGFVAETRGIASLWGADAVRNSDGTKLDASISQLNLKIYEAYFPTRGNNDFIEQALEQRPQMFLMSDRVVATSEVTAIDPMAGYFSEELDLNLDADPNRYWEVIDRTSGAVMNRWSLSDNGAVEIKGTTLGHEYTVSFLAYIKWDPVEMYNHLTNDWGDKPPEIPFDVRHPRSRAFIIDTFKLWCRDNPQVDVVRFTTFFYQFALVFDNQAREKFVDWFGYGATVSPLALDQFEDVFGYRLRAEDFVDAGYYNSSFRVPTRAYLDYMSFVSSLVTDVAREMVDIAHDAGKETMMFLGDQWIGVEPYGPRFKEIGLDAIVGSVGDGTTLRMIADVPNVKYTEGRFLPYFFPDMFFEGNERQIVAEAKENWRKARRALLRTPLDRMGYGGYLSLATKFPRFIGVVEGITDEFRGIHDSIKGASPHSGLRIGVLNAWGKVRTWQAFTVAHALHSKESYSYYGILESLSGLPVKVDFISFSDIVEAGVPNNLDVIITGGGADTAFSGGDWWGKPELTATLRQWVRDGGALVGVGQPSAFDFQGRFFQLADCFGVDQERGLSQSSDKHNNRVQSTHFITADLTEPFPVGEGTASVYAIAADTEILSFRDEEIQLAANKCGNGRAVYISGLPYCTENARLLLRACYWASAREEEFGVWQSSNPNCDVNYYPAANTYCVANSTDRPQATTVTLGNAQKKELELGPDAIAWFMI